MRIEPSDKALRDYKPDPSVQKKIDHITRIVAIVVAFLSTFFFFIKILFL
ncbi:hypothetical protein MUGA111182_17035 [Mucilaginibacter galii]|uniref:Uncharacterized protein n=1 Tax=Mucilaginibacter galii TaxID=2005073 RepID=A0A917N0G0_9SPHI|nr:hypothetical protein [Mucilaginibacter galii]GGI49728.1 hypothetical protein GCM10011425_09400 [Mucilaginibacter galii]